MYIKTKGFAEVPRLISDEEYFALDKALQWFYHPVEDGGETISFDKSAAFKGEINKRRKTANQIQAEIDKAYEEYENSPTNLNKIVNQHYID